MPAPAPLPNNKDSWSYDALGNRLGDGLSYDTANRLTLRNNESVLYNGANGLGGSIVRGGGFGRTNTWDSQNRLVQTVHGGSTSSFTYGADGLRRSATVDGVTTKYLLDGQNVVQEIGPAGRITTLWGPRGPEARVAPDGSALWYVYDAHGNVLAEVDEQGVINPDQYGLDTAIRDFDPWGFVLNSRQVADNGNPLKYCGSLGHPSENNTGLIYMRARYYDPQTGRFISEDPAKDGGNWFAYAGGNPVANVDPDGRMAAADTTFSCSETVALGNSAGSTAQAVGRQAAQSLWNSFGRAFTNRMKSLFGDDFVDLGLNRAGTSHRWTLKGHQIRLDFSGTHNPNAVHWNLDYLGKSDPHLAVDALDDLVMVLLGL